MTTQARSWIITRNFKDGERLDAEQWLRDLFTRTKAVYVVGQLEKGLNAEREHIQAYINFSSGKTIGGLKRFCNEMHLEAVKVDNGVRDYCMKELTRVAGPWEYGVKPVRRNSKTDWEEVLLNAKRGKLDLIPPQILVSHYGNLQKIAKDNIDIKDCDHLRGVWIYGQSGVGKSWSARQKYPDAYPKLCNKWWDGYKGQKNVIMDDIGLDHKCLGQQLKIWADRYACVLETKGGAVASTYENFVITSQYTIEEIWSGDQATIDALKRRFQIIYIPYKMRSDSEWNIPLKEDEL